MHHHAVGDTRETTSSTSRHHSSGHHAVEYDRIKARRLADVRRGNQTRQQMQLLAEAMQKSSSNSSSKASSLSATEKREGGISSIPELQARHSCPSLPIISSALSGRQTITMVTDSRGAGSGNITTRPASPTKLPNKHRKRESSSLLHNDKDDNIGMSDKADLNILQRPFSKEKISFPNVDSGKKPIGEILPKSISNELPDISSKKKIRPNQEDGTLQKPATTSSIPIIKIQTWKEVRTTRGNGDCNANDDVAMEKRDSGKRYSVLLNGGILSTNAPYVDVVEAHPDEGGKEAAATTSNKGDNIPTQTTQKPTQIKQGEAGAGPKRVSGTREMRRLKSHKELFAFQQDLLLPRYRKLAGIKGGDAPATGPNETSRGAGGRGGDILLEDLRGRAGHSRRSDAREVFDKVRLLIHGPDKAGADADKSNDRKMGQAMPIYLKSGLPCGYVDPSSKCDAWLYANDFDD